MGLSEINVCISAKIVFQILLAQTEEEEHILEKVGEFMRRKMKRLNKKVNFSFSIALSFPEFVAY